MPHIGDLYVRDLRPARDGGEAMQLPIVVLHSGWGYAYYPFDAAISSIARRFIIPDRSGYGRSRPRDHLPPGFHEDYARETLAILDALGVERCVFWGHSDGAVIAVHLALVAPARCAAIVLESLHVDREKPRSREFFERMASDPTAFGERVTTRLAAEHGESWQAIIRADGAAWLHIATRPGDLFDGRLRDVRVPALVLHGKQDPRTEPGELDLVRSQLPAAEIHLLDAGHSPHSDPATAATCAALVAEFLTRLR